MNGDETARAQRGGVDSSAKVIHGAYDDGTPWEHRYDLDLGGGHWLAWTSSHEQYEYVEHGGVPASAQKYHRDFGPLVRTGAIIYHVSGKNASGWCAAGMRFAWSAWERDHPDQVLGRAIWTFDGNFDAPTFSPSLLCACGECHGFVRAGRWESAGCAHGAVP